MKREGMRFELSGSAFHFSFYAEPRLPPADRLVRFAMCDTTLLRAIHFTANI